MKNLRQPRAAQWDNIRSMAAAAQGRFRLIGTISVAFGCPFEGAVDPGVVVADALRFAEAGVSHVALGDTTGLATPASMKAIVSRIQREAPARHADCAPARHARHRPRQRGRRLRGGRALFRLLVRRRRRASGAGQVRRRLYRQRLHRGPGEPVRVARHPTGIDLAGLIETAEFCEQTLGRELYGRVTRSGLNPLLRLAS